MARQNQVGFSVFIGLVLMFASLFLLAWPGVTGEEAGFFAYQPLGSLWGFWGWQGLYFTLGLGMGLLAAARAERALYLWLFLLFFLIVLFCNLNEAYLWSALWQMAWHRIAGLFALLLGFFFILCARYYTLQISIRSRSTRY